MISVLTPTIRTKGLDRVQKSLENQSFLDFEWLVEVGLPTKPNDLNKAYNRMLRRAKGELIVSLQDYIEVESDALEKLWNAYKREPMTCWTCPVGKLDGKNIKWDWRVHRDEECNWMEWEIDFGSVPLKALKEIGGFDEWLDDHTWTFDGVNTGFRLSEAGYAIKCMKDNKGVAIDHDKITKHPYRKLIDPVAHGERLDEFRRGLRLNYLDK